MGRRGYPAEFRRRVLDLIDTGRLVADVAVDPVSPSRPSTTGGARTVLTRASRRGSAPANTPSSPLPASASASSKRNSRCIAVRPR